MINLHVHVHVPATLDPSIKTSSLEERSSTGPTLRVSKRKYM